MRLEMEALRLKHAAEEEERRKAAEVSRARVSVWLVGGNQR